MVHFRMIVKRFPKSTVNSETNQQVIRIDIYRDGIMLLKQIEKSPPK